MKKLITENTKAGRIFRNTYYKSMSYVEDNGEERNPDGRLIGWSSLLTDESVCTRTLNDVQKEINHFAHQLDIWKKFDIGAEKDHLRRMALEMTQVTLDNHRKRLAERGY